MLSKVKDAPMRVRIQHLIGRGGSAEVYAGQMGELPVAVKAVVYEPNGPDAETRGRDVLARIWEEVGTQGRSGSLCVPEVHGVGQFALPPRRFLGRSVERVALLIVMERIDGPSCDEFRGDLTWPQAASIGHDVASAMLDIRRAIPDFTHRDVKPSNIKLRRGSSGRVLTAVLLDFGACKSMLREHTPLHGDHTVAGGLIGTLGYLAPECFLPAPPVRTAHMRDVLGVARDVFALGMSLYSMCLYAPPLKRAMHGPAGGRMAEMPLRPAEYKGWWRQAQRDMDPFLARMLHPDPLRRPSWAEVREAFVPFRGACTDIPAAAHDVDLGTGRIPLEGETVMILPPLTEPPSFHREASAAPIPGTQFIRIDERTDEPEQDDLPTTISDPGLVAKLRQLRAADPDDEPGEDDTLDNVLTLPPPPADPTLIRPESAPAPAPASPPAPGAVDPRFLRLAGAAVLGLFALAFAGLFLGAVGLWALVSIGGAA